LTEVDWITCDKPGKMLRYLHRKIEDEAFMRFSVACCRRIWRLITDQRSRAVVEVTESYMDRLATAEAAALVCTDWESAHLNGEIDDAAGGSTHDAIDSVWGTGEGHAGTVAIACFESVAYVATEHLRAANAPEAQLAAAWRAAADEERAAQCQILRILFGHLFAV